MKTYRVKVEQGEDGWLVAQTVNLKGAITQGRDLSELTFMIRDAIEQLTDTTDFAIELLVPPTVQMEARRTATAPRKRRRKAA